MIRSISLIGVLTATAACGNSSNGNSEPNAVALSSTGAATQSGGPSLEVSTTGASDGEVPAQPSSGGGGKGGAAPIGNTPTSNSMTADSSSPDGNVSGSGGMTGGSASGSGGTSGGDPLGTGGTIAAGGDGTGGTAAGGGGRDVGTGGSEAGGMGSGGQTSIGGQEGVGGASGGNGGLPSSCVGDAWTTADPTSAGPFQVAAEKNVGPLAGVVPDPIYGDEQQRFNIYRPSNLENSGYCHPILIWANGYRDNPEQNPPDCIVDSSSNQWCGQYLPLLEHLASHGFVVVAPLSTATAEGDPFPTTAGLDWILEQSEDPSSPYYHRLDTSKIGQLGHSYGGMSTCMTASDPRYSALATICGTRALEGVHTPMLFFCGGNDSTVSCSGVRDTFLTVTDQPAFFINELNADHGSWVYQGANGVSLSSAAAWFRVHLMDDTENRRYFYGPNCTFCTDNRVETEQNSLMSQ